MFSFFMFVVGATRPFARLGNLRETANSNSSLAKSSESKVKNKDGRRGADIGLLHSVPPFSLIDYGGMILILKNTLNKNK